jgi:uncharacterized membrane protein
MSRKTLLTVVAVLGAILSAFGFVNAGPAVGGMAAVAVYVLFEAKADIAAVKAQVGRFKDPKFWITAVSAIIAALQSSGVTLPIDSNIIISVLTVIVGILFGTTTPKTVPAPAPKA